MYPACTSPWIHDYVNQWAANSTNVYDPTKLSACCTAPGVCHSLTAADRECSAGWLDCHVGATSFVCDLMNHKATPSVCNTEGNLSQSRTDRMPCCAPVLNTFLARGGPETCLSTKRNMFHWWLCCKENDQVGSCEWVDGCIGYQGFRCTGGNKITVCTDGRAGDYCSSEFQLGAVQSTDCKAAVIPPAGTCTAGLSLPPPTEVKPTTTTTVGTRPTASNPRPTAAAVGSPSTKMTKALAVAYIGALVLQSMAVL